MRHAAAETPIEAAAVRAYPGPIFEQWVGIELWKRLQYLGNARLQYLRTKAGAEVDFIIVQGGRFIPIEVKWTEHPSLAEARHLQTFLDEHPSRPSEAISSAAALILWRLPIGSWHCHGIIYEPLRSAAEEVRAYY